MNPRGREQVPVLRSADRGGAESDLQGVREEARAREEPAWRWEGERAPPDGPQGDSRPIGCVVDPRNEDSKMARELGEDEVIVDFVVAGEYEWYDKNLPNSLKGNYPKSKLSFVCFPPEDLSNFILEGEEDNFLYWKWRVR